MSGAKKASAGAQLAAAAPAAAPVPPGDEEPVRAFVDPSTLVPGEGPPPTIAPTPMKVRVKRLTPTSILPRYATDGAAAFDLHADGIGDRAPPRPAPGQAVDLGTGLAFEVPAGHVMLIFSRSGHAWKHDVRLANCVGVIDPDYRGEVRVKLAADAMRDSLRIRQGDRIAQALIVAAPRVDLVEVDELDDTARGETGFGSTGVAP